MNHKYAQLHIDTATGGGTQLPNEERLCRRRIYGCAARIVRRQKAGRAVHSAAKPRPKELNELSRLKKLNEAKKFARVEQVLTECSMESRQKETTATRSRRDDSVQKLDTEEGILSIRVREELSKNEIPPPADTVALPSTYRRTPLKPGSKGRKCIRMGHIRGI